MRKYDGFNSLELGTVWPQVEHCSRTLDLTDSIRSTSKTTSPETLNLIRKPLKPSSSPQSAWTLETSFLELGVMTLNWTLQIGILTSTWALELGSPDLTWTIRARNCGLNLNTAERDSVLN